MREFFIWYSAFSFSEELTPNKDSRLLGGVGGDDLGDARAELMDALLVVFAGKSNH